MAGCDFQKITDTLAGACWGGLAGLLLIPGFKGTNNEAVLRALKLPWPVTFLSFIALFRYETC